MFCAYGGPLLAQDELQVAEHPVLGSLREALRALHEPAVTVTAESPTPVLVRNAERRVILRTDPDPARGRPHSLYGSNFGYATEPAIRAAVEAVDPPTLSNILAIEAPRPSFGVYSQYEIRWVLRTAYSGYRAAIEESRMDAPDCAVEIHTGHWGCGAYGGNRTLMTVLQVLAARMAGADRLIYHHGPTNQLPPVTAGLARLNAAFSEAAPLNDVVSRLVAERFTWGMSDGN